MAAAAASGRVRVTTDVREARHRQRDFAGLRGHAVGAQRQPGPGGDAAARARHRRGAARTKRRRTCSCSARRSRRAPSRTCCGRSSSRRRARRTACDFHLCFQPEFLREGTSIRDYDKPPFTIVGANHAVSGRQAARAVRPPAVRVPDDVGARRGDGQVLLQQLPRAEDHVRQRDRAAVRRAGRRSVRGDGPRCARTRSSTSRTAYLKPGLRVRRLVPAEGPARDDAPRQAARRRAADAGRHPAVEPRCTSSARSTRCWQPASAASA